MNVILLLFLIESSVSHFHYFWPFDGLLYLRIVVKINRVNLQLDRVDVRLRQIGHGDGLRHLLVVAILVVDFALVPAKILERNLLRTTLGRWLIL